MIEETPEDIEKIRKTNPLYKNLEKAREWAEEQAYKDMKEAGLIKTRKEYIKAHPEEMTEEEKKAYEKERRETIGEIFTRRGQAEAFTQENPLFFDKSSMFWVFDEENYKYNYKDDTDVLNLIHRTLVIDTITSKNKNEIIEALRQVGREMIPEESRPTWVQLKDRIIDIQDDREYPSSPKYFITNPIPWDLGESEETPTIDRLFTEWVGEGHKEELYEVIAFSIIPKYFIHRIIVLIGAGSNGKSTFLRLLKKFVGVENVTSSSLDVLSEVRFESAKLYKKLVCLFGETNFNSLKKTEVIKSATGEDVMRGEFKGKTPFDFENYAKWIIATNTLPRTYDKTIGFYRRWKIIDFPNQFKKEKDILSEIPESEFKNLSRKCLRILKKLWKTRTFTNEGTFEERKRNYEEKSNPLTSYVEENYEEDINSNVSFPEFSKGYRKYLSKKGHRDKSAILISKELRSEGYEIKTMTYKKNSRQNSSYKAILGLKLIEEKDKKDNTEALEPKNMHIIHNTHYLTQEPYEEISELKDKKDKKDNIEELKKKVLIDYDKDIPSEDIFLEGEASS